MIDHPQFMSNISPNIRPQQQSSPSENSMSTATPPNQVSRASPASTALVMSSSNINQQPTSRQLTPNTNSSSGSNHINHHHNHSPSSNTNSGVSSSSISPSNVGTQHIAGPPNPMVRQFACHAKSMSAGVVVSVPGISNNLATATGMNQNNIINNNIVSSKPNHQIQTHGPSGHPHPHHTLRAQQQQQQQQQLQQQQLQLQQHQQQQQVIREHQMRNHHHQQLSQPVPMAHQQQHHQLQQQQQHHQQQQQQQQQQQHHHQYNPNGSNQNFIISRQATSSSIIPSNQNINNIHNRSASTHLSNVLLGPQATHAQANNLHQRSNSNYPSHVTNSVWSIDENISKSHGKLTTSGCIPHPYLFKSSIADMSCDNVSNASRLIDGVPAPGYYLHPPVSGNLANSNGLLSASGNLKSSEFLPICDLMFNFISMIIYFCENTFNIIALIALYYHTTYKHWALVGAAFVAASIFCQYLSFKWLYKTKLEDCKRKREAQEELENEEDCERRYYNRMAANLRNYPCGSCNWLPDSTTEVQLKFILSVALDAILHLFCLGFLWRYIKLVIPVNDTARVKKEARDLCMLRMIHGFVQSAPLLLLQAYLICSQTIPAPIVNLSVTSAILSLINVCWALASFTKYARKKYMHMFVLTWPGIVCQFLWRLGTVSSRVVALTIYGYYYGHWMLVVLSLHWLVMFLWFVTPGNLLKDEINLPKAKKLSLAMGMAWIHCFCYVNFEEHNSKLKMVIYYLIMFLSNNLLLTLCLIFSSQVTWFKNLSILVVYLGFALGMLFMFLYYKYFHVTVLNHGCSQESVDSIADQLSPAGKKIAGFKPGTLRLKSEDSLTSSGHHRFNNNINANLHTGSQPEITRNIKPPYLSASQAPLPQSGVFNCKLNSGLKKQKMPNSHRHNNLL